MLQLLFMSSVAMSTGTELKSLYLVISHVILTMDSVLKVTSLVPYVLV